MPELIDRQALIADYRICGGCSSFENCSGHITMCDSARVRQAINEAQTIDAEPVRRGRWKKKNGEIYCTNCKKSKWSESFELMLRGFDFCPKCGADMREGGAEND